MLVMDGLVDWASGNSRVFGSILGSNSLFDCHNLWRSGAVAMETKLALKLTVETHVEKSEKMISVTQCVIPLGKGLVSHCSVVPMGL